MKTVSTLRNWSDSRKTLGDSNLYECFSDQKSWRILMTKYYFVSNIDIKFNFILVLGKWFCYKL